MDQHIHVQVVSFINALLCSIKLAHKNNIASVRASAACVSLTHVYTKHTNIHAHAQANLNIHTHIRSLPLSISSPLTLSLFLSFSLTLFPSLSHTHKHSLKKTHTHTLSYVYEYMCVCVCLWVRVVVAPFAVSRVFDGWGLLFDLSQAFPGFLTTTHFMCAFLM